MFRSSTVSSTSARSSSSYVTHNTVCSSCYFQFASCSFGLNSYITHNTVCSSCYFQFASCSFGLSSYLTHNTVFRLLLSSINCFFGLSSYGAENTISFIFSSPAVPLASARTSHITQFVSVVTIRASTVSSTLAGTSQRTL